MKTSGHDPLIDELAAGVLLDTADEARRAQLATLLAASAENRRRFLGHAALHAMLAREAKAGAFAENPDLFFRRLESPESTKRVALLRYWLPAAAAAALVFLLTFSVLPNRADASIDRVIQAMDRILDRTYAIQVVEPGIDPVPARADRGRFPAENHLDGATLWLRRPGEFLLRQSLPDGETRILGADGARSWSVRGDGPVRISVDPSRFGRALADSSAGIAFLDPRTQLADLKRLYDLEWLDRPASGFWKLAGKRRSSDQGGPREIEVWFQPESGLLERLILRQLPRANGGPRSLAIILRSTEPLPQDFFEPARIH